MSSQQRRSLTYRLLPWLMAMNAVLWAVIAHVDGHSTAKWIAADAALIAFVFCVAGRALRR